MSTGAKSAKKNLRAVQRSREQRVSTNSPTRKKTTSGSRRTLTNAKKSSWLDALAWLADDRTRLDKLEARISTVELRADRMFQWHMKLKEIPDIEALVTNALTETLKKLYPFTGFHK